MGYKIRFVPSVSPSKEHLKLLNTCAKKFGGKIIYTLKNKTRYEITLIFSSNKKAYLFWELAHALQGTYIGSSVK